MPGDSGVTVVTMLVCLFYFACEAAGASCARHSLRPLIFQGQDFQEKLARKRAARSRSCVCRHCEERSDEAIQLPLPHDGLLRFARNDVERCCCLKFVSGASPGCHSGMRRLAQARNPYSRSWLWIPGSCFARPGMTNVEVSVIARSDLSAVAQRATASAEARRAKAEGGSDEAIQNCRNCAMDCFAEPVIGRAFARPVGSQ